MKQTHIAPDLASSLVAAGTPLVRVEGLTKRFAASPGVFGRARAFTHAVDDVSFEVGQGESLGLVGESGCGKTTIGKLLVRLLEPTSGRILFGDGKEGYVDIASFRGRALRGYRRRAQMIFQDPYESINPRRTVFDTVAEPLSAQRIGAVGSRLVRVGEMLERVGLSPPSSFLFRYPHELSGGQRQRVAIARALIVNPSFVVADEPTSMLDVSVRTGIMALMTELAQRRGISYLYITHDLAVARYMCARIAVMYMGKLVEVAETEELLKRPLHPYTRALLAAVPGVRPLGPGKGSSSLSPNPRPPTPDPRLRCRFYDRCPIASETCRTSLHPPLEDKGGGRMVACYRA